MLKGNYLEIAKDILLISCKNVLCISTIESKSYFDICCHGYTLCRLKLTGKLNYWLIDMPIHEFKQSFKTPLEFTQANISEGVYKTRLFIQKPSDIFEFKDIILKRYDQCCEWNYWHAKYQEEREMARKQLGILNTTTTRNKGNSLLAFPDEYIVIDTETTGLDPEFCELIEFAAIKIKRGKEIGRFQTLIKPEKEINRFITELTGITNEAVEKAPSPAEILPHISDFIGNDILVAHNAHFDINFLYDYFERYLGSTLSNDFICTMRLAKKLFPTFSNHKLNTICNNLNIDPPIHRSLQDVIATQKVYSRFKQFMDETIDIDEFCKTLKKKGSTIKTNEIAATVDSFNPNHLLYGKYCVFTGSLLKMSREEAMHIVVNLGGKCSNSVTKKTSYLIMGMQDYSKFTDGEKSNKTKTAETLIQGGQELEIISENVFYELVLQDA